MNIKKLLGKRIQEIRKSLGMTQEKVAESMNIETSSLSNIENGKYYPTAENLEKICLVLGIPPEMLFQFEHLQNEKDLVLEINSRLTANPEKIRDVYKIVKAITE